MKRLLIILTAAVMVLCMMSGCANDSNDNELTKAPDTTAADTQDMPDETLPAEESKEPETTEESAVTEETTAETTEAVTETTTEEITVSTTEATTVTTTEEITVSATEATTVTTTEETTVSATEATTVTTEDKKPSESKFTISEDLIKTQELGLKVNEPLSEAFKKLGYTNPVSSEIFFADPTTVVYEGRLYVYGTCDYQEYIANGKKGDNTYGKINTLACFSTDDMKNWTYHGTIPVGELCPWTGCSWAPTIASKENADGKTEFFLYFANGAGGIGVLKSDSPTGPWVDPIGKPLIAPNANELARDPVFWCFDPGVCVDENGDGWMVFGGGDPLHEGESGLQTGNCRIVKLGDDMISLASEMKVIKAPYHFEANEINYINGKYLLTYCSNWFERKEWPGEYKYAKPELCTMCYMVSSDPLNPDSWEYMGEYIKNPTGFGYPFSNNHTNIIKFNEKYYSFYQTVSLGRNMNIIDTAYGYRSVGVNEIKVDEENGKFSLGTMNDRGASQIKAYDPYRVSQAETYNVGAGVEHKQYDKALTVKAKDGAWTAVCQADFGEKGASAFAASVKGKGVIEIRLGTKDGQKIGEIQFDTDGKFKTIYCELSGEAVGKKNIFFVYGGEFEFDKWQFAG